ncbi:MAG: hypothetical protein BWY45_03373 [Euryarchaeota archaeon ADurb.Bin294]|nr:MAG: hypothetical protein BWY45_03373 [Euryarchaeota archaeon ADurb.Bin294]
MKKVISCIIYTFLIGDVCGYLQPDQSSVCPPDSPVPAVIPPVI